MTLRNGSRECTVVSVATDAISMTYDRCLFDSLSLAFLSVVKRVFFVNSERLLLVEYTEMKRKKRDEVVRRDKKANGEGPGEMVRSLNER